MATHFNRLLAALLITTAAYSHAAATSSLQLQITILGSCSFVTADDLVMDFGALSDGDHTINARVPISCTNGTDFYVRLSDGLYPSGTQRNMALRNGTARLPYSLSISPTTGISQGTTVELQLSATVREVDYANKPVGRYTDTVVLTVNP
jgi:spore coat protein U-like protein